MYKLLRPNRTYYLDNIVTPTAHIFQFASNGFPFFQFLDLGIVTSIECNHKEVETAKKGEEVCIKIEPIPGESPKMFGRHFDETDLLVSKVSNTK